MANQTPPTLRAAIEALRDALIEHSAVLVAGRIVPTDKVIEALTAALAQPDAGEGIEASVVRDLPGCPVSARCVLEGCRDFAPPSPQPSLTREVCICAAIKLPDGRVINGHRHHNCFAAIAELASVDPSIPSRSKRFEQGFTTSHRRFVNREEGLALQLAAGIPSADPVRKGYGNQLFSEDLY